MIKLFAMTNFFFFAHCSILLNCGFVKRAGFRIVLGKACLCYRKAGDQRLKDL